MRKKKPFVIGEKQVAAVKLFVDGDYKVQDVAATLNVNRVTVWRWYQHEEMRRYHERYYRKRISEIKRDFRRTFERKKAKIEAKLAGGNPYIANETANKILDFCDGKISMAELFKD